MKGKKVVVTGGSGFIGSNLTQELSKENQVTVVDNLSTGYLENIQNLINSGDISFVEGSITDMDLLQKLFEDVDYIFHQAAIPSVPRSVKDPISSNYTNVNGTLNVLVAARDNNVKKLIYASSSSAYGDTPVLPKSEDMKPCPLSPYAISKLTAEYYCQVFSDVYNLATASLRYFNVFGPRQDPSSEYAAVIPKFIGSILNDKSPLVYGDGEQTRDFTFVDDVVNANILAAESMSTGVFNIAGGERISINDLAGLIMELLDKDLDITHIEPQPGDIKHSLADISKAREQIRYIPKFNVKDGLKETVKWFQQIM
ncbi:MAG: SDR family oxidoreductase [Thermoplasmatales archaeon]|nr:SDR family oxidoreductase [Thermoplasmatales archaeon]